MITIQEEFSYDTLVEGLALAEQHYNEVESKAKLHPFNPKMDQLRQLQQMGMLCVVTAREENGNLIGYFLMALFDDLINGQRVAQELGIYVARKYRGGSTFVRMEKKMSNILMNRGFKEMRIMFKTGHNNDIPIRLGYEETERVYQKLLLD